MNARGPVQAIGRMLRQAGTDSLYNMAALPAAVLSFALIITGLSAGAGTLIVGVGFAIGSLTMLIARASADLHRVTMPAVVRRPSVRPVYRKAPEGAGWFRRMINPMLSGQSWLDVLAGLLDFPFAIIAFVFTVVWWSLALGGLTYGLWDWSIPYGKHHQGGAINFGDRPLTEIVGLPQDSHGRIILNTALGVVFLITLPLIVRMVALIRAHVARPLICTIGEMRAQITGLQEQKAAAASAEAIALRRLERDIHDGPQQRLVRLAMDLGRAKAQVDKDPAAARATIDEALGQTRETLDELRALSRGIAPPILTDRGLSSALAALGGRSPVPVDLAIAPDVGRLDPGLETTAYFVVAEALTNVAKHSGARTATVTVARAAKKLGIVIADDGVGGASMAKGHGLAGLSDRVRATGGTLDVISPDGGPTEIRVELPCV